MTGVDASAEMIAAARRRAKAAGFDFDLVEGNARTLPFSDARFDVVVSVATLCFSDDPLGPMREMVRVLKPGGRLVLGELGRWNAWAAQRRVKGWLGSAVWRAAHFRSRADLLALADAAGLRGGVTGAIFYPPLDAAARFMAPIDAWLGRWTTVGAAFLVLSASKPYVPEAVKEPA
jgi:SAM-dependent methyltransferase